MKEYIHNIDNEDYHSKVYPLVVKGEMTMIPHMFEDTFLVLPNPERYRPIESDPIQEPKPKRHPLQGEFMLTSGVKFMKPLILADFPRVPQK